jgi:hypothetical protein
MRTITWCKANELLREIVPRLQHCQVLLDIGCGINPQEYVRPLVHICCDPFQQYLERLQQRTTYERDRVYVLLRATWSEVVHLFPPKSVDTIFLVDVIEHLEKDEGMKLLAVTEQIARQQVVIFTPLGFMPQHHPNGKDAWGLDGAEWQEHRSGWLPEDFGASWDILGSPDFHQTDNLGRKLERPFGAFWAIKTHARPDVRAHKFYQTSRLWAVARGVLPRDLLRRVLAMLRGLKP